MAEPPTAPGLGSTAELLLAPGIAYLYTAAEGPPLRAHEAALAEYLSARAEGETGRTRHAAVERECRELLAHLLAVDPTWIAFMANVSEALASVAGAVEWQRGDNVVITDLEFPSNVLPWLRLRPAGVNVRVVRSRGWVLDPADLAAAIDERTRVVSVSHVSYLSGARVDLTLLADAAHACDALLVVDATQSLGVVPVPAGVADIVVASSYKWLLGPHGLGIVAVDPTRTATLEPPLVGWRSISDMFSAERFERFTRWPDARRWELAFPAYPALYMLLESLRWLLELGVAPVERHVLGLGERLIDGLSSQGRVVMTPRPDAARAGNVAVVADDGGALAERLSQEGVLAWGGDGRIRFSLHAFNAEQDVDAALHCLDQAGTG